MAESEHSIEEKAFALAEECKGNPARVVEIWDELEQRRAFSQPGSYDLQEALFKELARRAEHYEVDARTGLPDSNAFKQELLHMSIIASRHPDRGFSLIMIDLDAFKEINDEIGHTAGDQVLEQVAEVLKGRRLEDEAFRYGGDEFAILTQNTDAIDVLTHVEYLRDEVAKIRIGGRQIQFSVGWATTDHLVSKHQEVAPEKIRDAMLEGADERLRYESNQRRRQRSTMKR